MVWGDWARWQGARVDGAGHGQATEGAAEDSPEGDECLLGRRRHGCWGGHSPNAGSFAGPAAGKHWPSLEAIRPEPQEAAIGSAAWVSTTTAKARSKCIAFDMPSGDAHQLPRTRVCSWWHSAI